MTYPFETNPHNRFRMYSYIIYPTGTSNDCPLKQKVNIHETRRRKYRELHWSTNQNTFNFLDQFVYELSSSDSVSVSESSSSPPVAPELESFTF
mmetsp:Transcript_7105/g.15322  ORF Transcript_7105/g.15322 Transcript_7105/m.15322 type:complete len:94 (-) Transcript_7105:833-1114(-)